jgi:hypothetical protein
MLATFSPSTDHCQENRRPGVSNPSRAQRRTSMQRYSATVLLVLECQ